MCRRIAAGGSDVIEAILTMSMTGVILQETCPNVSAAHKNGKLLVLFEYLARLVSSLGRNTAIAEKWSVGGGDSLAQIIWPEPRIENVDFQWLATTLESPNLLRRPWRLQNSDFFEKEETGHPPRCSVARRPDKSPVSTMPN